MISKVNCNCSNVNFKGAKSLPVGSIARYLKEYNNRTVYELPVIIKVKSGENSLTFSKFAARFANIRDGFAKLCGSIFG